MSTVVLESLAVLDVTHGAGMRYTPRSALPLVPASPRRWQAGLMPRLKGPTALFRSWKTLPAGRLGSGRVSRQGAVVCKAQDTAVDAPDVTKSTWKTLVLDSKKSVLIEFWAPWCGPCRMILPVIAKLSKTYEDKITCFKINTDESPDFATQYGIRSIPTKSSLRMGRRKMQSLGLFQRLH